jgi:hypothetical protein
MPAGVGNAYAFQVFNTMSYTIVLATPMILYFKKLGASATVLGIVLALPALLNILQIPAARFVETMGYRAFVLRGWTLRAAFILAMAGVALLPEKIDALTRIALMLFLLFAYNASRGISLCGFLPWVTQWIPEEVRGRYVSRDQMSSALATLGTMILAAFYLRPPEAKYAYGLLFFASFVTVIISLWFLRRIPDVPVPPSSESSERVPYKEIPRRPGRQRRVLDSDAPRLVRGDGFIDPGNDGVVECGVRRVPVGIRPSCGPSGEPSTTGIGDVDFRRAP